eukprot:scaffold4298_cov183-Amphora_coffeaeformis.AAC.5
MPAAGFSPAMLPTTIDAMANLPDRGGGTVLKGVATDEFRDFIFCGRHHWIDRLGRAGARVIHPSKLVHTKSKKVTRWYCTIHGRYSK